jgi:hypothetical protein
MNIKEEIISLLKNNPYRSSHHTQDGWRRKIVDEVLNLIDSKQSDLLTRIENIKERLIFRRDQLETNAKEYRENGIWDAAKNNSLKADQFSLFIKTIEDNLLNPPSQPEPTEKSKTPTAYDMIFGLNEDVTDNEGVLIIERPDKKPEKKTLPSGQWFVKKDDSPEFKAAVQLFWKRNDFYAPGIAYYIREFISFGYDGEHECFMNDPQGTEITTSDFIEMVSNLSGECEHSFVPGGGFENTSGERQCVKCGKIEKTIFR